MPRTDFIERRLSAMPPVGHVLALQVPGFPKVNVCSVRYAGEIFTRVWNAHGKAHYDGDLDVREAAARFSSGEE